MENKKENVALSDYELDKVAGGFTLDPGSDSINDACPYDPSCHVGKFMSLFCSSCPKKQGEGE